MTDAPEILHCEYIEPDDQLSNVEAVGYLKPVYGTTSYTRTDIHDELKAEVADCHKDINTKADFIEKSINDSAQDFQTIDELKAENERLRAVLEEADHAQISWILR